MQESLPLLAAHLRVCIAEHEADGRKEITLPRAITTDNYIVLRGEWLDYGLFFVAKLIVSACTDGYVGGVATS